MTEGVQGEFVFVEGWKPAAETGGTAPTLDDEIAAVWRLPIGRRVEVVLRGHDLQGIGGLLEVAEAPDLPFDPHKPLRMRIGHVTFTSRQIESWKLP